MIDDGSFQPTPISGGPVTRESHAASNALLVGAKRSKTGRPILVGGPQVGYFFPQFFMEVDLHGGGYDARGALLPGLPFVVIGRGPGLRLDRDVVAGRQRRHLRREPVRERRSTTAAAGR